MESERVDRFWAKVNILSENDCWEWQASVNSKGYGSFAIAPKKTALAHKVSWALAKNNGVLSDAKSHIMHSCDNKRCVNPSHLSLGTPADNVRDMVNKGRNVNRRPSENDFCKNGHPRTEENTHPIHRTCLVCVRKSNREAARRRRENDREAYNAYHREYQSKNWMKRYLKDD